MGRKSRSKKIKRDVSPKPSVDIPTETQTTNERKKGNWTTYFTATFFLGLVTFGVKQGYEYYRDQQELHRTRPILQSTYIQATDTIKDIVYDIHFKNKGQRQADNFHISFTLFTPKQTLRFRGMPAANDYFLVPGDSSAYRDFICKTAISPKEFFNATVVVKYTYRDVDLDRYDSTFDYFQQYLDPNNQLKFRGLEAVEYKKAVAKYRASWDYPFFQGHQVPDEAFLH